MSCFPCFKSQRSKKSLSRKEAADSSTKSPENKKVPVAEAKDGEQGENKFINAKAYNFRELATATKNFRQECLLGEGGFGKVFKGTFQSNGQVVAVKQLDRHGLNESKEFLADISSLSLLNHPNLVNLVGYCADGDQRILVYEYMTGGSLESHLFIEQGKNKKPLDWFTRIKIASGAARGMEYLHEQANPPVIYSYLKASNILLDEEFNPKLSDIGLTKLSPSSDKMQGPSRMMGTYGYCAPEYTRSGEVSLKSDVYSFGVVLLEIITGRRAVDTTRPSDEQNLVTWAQPYFRDPKKFPDLADPLLQGKFIEKDLNQVVGIAAMCLQEESMVRPLISDVVTTLSFLTTIPPEGFYPPPAEAAAPSENQEDKDDDQDDASSKCSKDEDTYSNDASDVDIDEDVSDDGDVSDSQDEKSEDEYEAATTKEAKLLKSKSSRKSNSSDDEGSVCSSRSSSSRSLDGSESSTSLGSSRRSGSNLRELSPKSSKGSRRLLGALSNKKSKKSTKRSDLKGQESRKSSTETYESFSQSSSLVSSDRGSTADLSASLSCKRIQDGDTTLQANQQQEMKE